jgi:hypothetical protein
MSNDRQSHSFVFRIWWEEGELAPIWRGWVQHAASGDACYVHRVADLVAFVETHTGALDVMPGEEIREGTNHPPYSRESN